MWGGAGSLVQTAQMRRPLSIALASLFVAALVAPTAQGATRTHYFQQVGDVGYAEIKLNVIYKDKHGNGHFTPRSVAYEAQVGVFCHPAPTYSFTASVASSSTKRIRLKKNDDFSYSYSRPVPGTTPMNTGKATGRVPSKPKQPVDGTVEVFSYTTPPDFLNCTSDGPMPYRATPCRPLHNRPPYIKPSLPGCVSAL